MFKLDVSAKELGDFVGEMEADEFVKFMYCQKISATFLAIQLMEHRVIDLMYMCDRIHVGKVLKGDQSKWNEMLEKHSRLQGSTLGSLIRILDGSGISAGDISYLRWLKEKRDYFIHRIFHRDPWPGEVNASYGIYMLRRLQAIEIWMNRAERRLPQIFQRAGLIELVVFEGSGELWVNRDLFRAVDEG